nr:zinc finger, CCHC-type [Tanacetum cinerariifolium]
MGDANPIRALRDYSKPSHEGYRNTIELSVGNNVVTLRSNTIQLVQNGCSFYGLQSEDPKQHLKDFLKLVDSLVLGGENKERTCMRLFQFFLRDQASSWLERLPASVAKIGLGDKYVKRLELGKNRSAFLQGEVSAKMEDPELFTLPCRLRNLKPFDTLADFGSCVNIISLYLFKKLNIRLLGETDHIFGLASGSKFYPVGIVKDVEVRIGKLKLLKDFYVIDMKKDPKTILLVGRGFIETANAVIDYRKSKIVVREGITRSVFRVKGVNLGEKKAPYWTTLRKRESHKP